MVKLTHPKHQVAFKQLYPLYLVSSDDLLLKLETLQEIKSHLKKQGFQEWVRLDLDSDPSQKQWLQQTRNLSLFSEKQAFILECHQFTEALKDLLQAYLSTQSSDCVLLVSIPKLDKRQMETKWYQNLEPKMCHITIWPPEAQAMPTWLKNRASQLGITLDSEAIFYLCEHSENNTLAAAQELDKLKLLCSSELISLEQLKDTIHQSSRYDTYELSDAVLKGELHTARQIFFCLKTQKTELFSLLLTMSYALKQVLKLQELTQIMPSSQAFQQCGIWPKKAPIYEAALNRWSFNQILQLLFEASECERVLKGLKPCEDKDAYFERWLDRCCTTRL